ncbi:MAG TPA: hypothetical protein VGM67_14050 [Gemmatimonadaceae bacterium]
MTDSARSRAPWAFGAAALVLFFVFTVPVSGATVGARFLASLRIAKPKVVTAAAPAAGNSRQLQNVIAGILAETTTVEMDEPDAAVPSVDSASRAAATTVHTIGARRDTATAEVLGAHQTTVHVNRGQVQTLFAEAGRPSTMDASLNGAVVTLTRPRGVRVQYGHCPAPIANTLQNQIQGPPPPSTDNGDCVMLTEVPLASVTVPAALDTAAVMDIALELSGMSPNQVRDFRSLFGWREALGLTAPRGIRAYQMVTVHGAKAMLMNTIGRREPTYSLIWVRDGVVYTLAGYGASGDAVSLAESVS